MNEIFCACGCGNKLNRYDKKGRLHHYLHGHNRPWLGKHRTLETKEKLRRAFLGRKLTPATIEKIRKSNLGKKHISRFGSKSSNWRGGRRMSTYGYILIYSRGHPFADRDRYLFEHRLVMEKHIGRYLRKEEIVHHLDGNKTNNDISNLILLPNAAAHKKYHKEIGKETRFNKL